MVVEIGRQLLFAAFPLALAYAAASDLLTMTIANRLVAAMLGDEGAPLDEALAATPDALRRTL